MCRMAHPAVIGAIAAFALPPSALADAGEVWSFDLSTSGADVHYTSPTSVDPNASEYDANFQIDTVNVWVQWSGFDFGPIDVTDELPADLLMGTASTAGPAPISVYSNSIVYPEPPEPTTIAAEIDVTLDAAGFGQLAVTDVVLGTMEFDTGAFGMQTVTLTEVQVIGSVTVTPVTPGNPADLTGDGMVNVFDLLELLGQWGACPRGVRGSPGNCPADLTDDDVVNVFDLLELLGSWG